MEMDMEEMMLDLPGLGDILGDLDFPTFGEDGPTAPPRPAVKAPVPAPAPAAGKHHCDQQQQQKEGRVVCGWSSAASACANARAAGPEDSIPCGHTLSEPSSPGSPAPAAAESASSEAQLQEAGLGLRHALPRINCPSTIQDTSCGVTMSSPKFNSSTVTVGSPIFNEIARLQIHSPKHLLLMDKKTTATATGRNRKEEENNNKDGAAAAAAGFQSSDTQFEFDNSSTNALLPSAARMNHHQQQAQAHTPLPLSALTSVDARGQWQLSACGVEVVHILLACAEAVAAGQTALAGSMLSHLKRLLNPHGTPMQRVATYFTNALSFRLGIALPVPSLAASAFGGAPPEEAFMAYQVFYACCPYLIVTHFCANQAILEAFEGENWVHIVDLDIKQGLQWPSLIQALSLRKGGPPALLRITALAQGPGDMPTLLSTGARLADFAASVAVPFHFTVAPRACPLAQVEPWMVERRPEEALAVNCVSALHTLLAAPPQHQLAAFLATLAAWEPAVVTLVEQDASHNEAAFIPRFVDALHYYSSMFDSLASTLAGSPMERQMVEAHLFGNEIMNIVGCEGDERYMRHVPVETWFRLMADAGFRPAPLSSQSIYQARFLVSRFVGSLYPAAGSYRVLEEDGYLSLGWQENPLFSVSCWC